MCSDDWIRARRTEQIEQRTQRILEAARGLFEVHNFEEITLMMVAEKTGFTRSNLYRYFATKEDVFLEILKDDLTVWANQIRELRSGDEFSATDFGPLWVDTTLANSRMLKILAILNTKLEPNSSLEALISFKQHLSTIQSSITEALLRIFPKLSPAAAHEFLSFQSALVIGAYPAMNPTDKQKAAMRTLGIPFVRETYRTMMINAVKCFFRDLM